jgi:hypothetical protein
MKEGENPGQKQLDKIYCESKSTCWINIWNKEGNGLGEKTRKRLKIDGSSCIFYKREDR